MLIRLKDETGKKNKFLYFFSLNCNFLRVREANCKFYHFLVKTLQLHSLPQALGLLYERRNKKKTNEFY